MSTNSRRARRQCPPPADCSVTCLRLSRGARLRCRSSASRPSAPQDGSGKQPELPKPRPATNSGPRPRSVRSSPAWSDAARPARNLAARQSARSSTLAHGASHASPSASVVPVAKPNGATVWEPEEAGDIPESYATSSWNGSDLRSEWRETRTEGRHRADSALRVTVRVRTDIFTSSISLTIRSHPRRRLSVLRMRTLPLLNTLSQQAPLPQFQPLWPPSFHSMKSIFTGISRCSGKSGKNSRLPSRVNLAKSPSFAAMQFSPCFSDFGVEYKARRIDP